MSLPIPAPPLKARERLMHTSLFDMFSIAYSKPISFNTGLSEVRYAFSSLKKYFFDILLRGNEKNHLSNRSSNEFAISPLGINSIELERWPSIRYKMKPFSYFIILFTLCNSL